MVLTVKQQAEADLGLIPAGRRLTPQGLLERIDPTRRRVVVLKAPGGYGNNASKLLCTSVLHGLD